MYKGTPSPVEFVLLLDDHLWRQRLRDRTELHYFSTVSEPFQMKRIAQIVQPLFQARGIQASVNSNVKEITESAIHSYEGASLAFDLAVLVPPHGAAKAIVEAGLAQSK